MTDPNEDELWADDEIACDSCGDSEEMTCPQCGGDGFVEDELGDMQICDECNGECFVPCEDCQ